MDVLEKWAELQPTERKCGVCLKVRPLGVFYGTNRTCRYCVHKQSQQPARIVSRDKTNREPSNRFTRSKIIATKRGVSWSLGFNAFKEIITKDCTYCNGPLPECGSAMDRLDHDKGYFIGNVVPCCVICNNIRAKMFTPKEMVKIGKVIRLIRLERVANKEPPLIHYTSLGRRKKRRSKYADEKNAEIR